MANKKNLEMTASEEVKVLGLCVWRHIIENTDYDSDSFKHCKDDNLDGFCDGFNFRCEKYISLPEVQRYVKKIFEGPSS